METNPHGPFLARIEEFALEWLDRPEERFPSKLELKKRALTEVHEAVLETPELRASDKQRLIKALTTAWESAYLFLDESDRFYTVALAAKGEAELAQDDAKDLQLSSFSDEDLLEELTRRLADRDTGYYPPSAE